MAVTAETLRLSQGLRKQADAIVDEQARDLVKAWVDAFEEIGTDLREATSDLVSAAKDGRVTRAQALRSTRLSKALAHIADALDATTTQAGVRIGTDLPDIVRAAGEAQQAIIASQLPASERAIVAGWSRVDADSIAAMVKRSTEQITASTYPISGDAYQAIRRELIRGVAVGDNPRQTAAEMVKRTEGAFNGGLTRALNVSRTEILDAHRSASRLGRTVNADTLDGWRWQCELSSRTCPACLAKHGEVFGGDVSGPDGHPSCRCSPSPLVKSWKDLGIAMDEPADMFPDAKAWFADQPEATQLGIMGPQRLAAVKADPGIWDRLAVKRDNPDWRTSWQTRPVKDLGIKATPTPAVPTLKAA
jgi:hypothetical protein